MITCKMIRYGYDKGVIKLIMSPNGDGVACQIGDNWFYFGGYTAEEYDTVEAYTADIPLDTILAEIFRTLEAFREDGEKEEAICADEYLYYDLYLREWGVMDSAADNHNAASETVCGSQPVYVILSEVDMSDFHDNEYNDAPSSRQIVAIYRDKAAAEARKRDLEETEKRLVEETLCDPTSFVLQEYLVL